MVAVGTELPPFVRPAGLHAWNRFAAVNDEFADIHMDDDAGRAAGMPGAFGMGNLIWAWMHAALEQWLGEPGQGGGQVEHLDCRFSTPALRGDTITISGSVTGARTEDGGTVLELDVWAQNQSGARIAPGTARVRLLSR